MVQPVLIQRFKVALFRVAVFGTLTLVAIPAWGSKRHKETPAEPVPELLLEGGRKLTFERSFQSEQEVRKPGFWGKLLDVVIGAPEFHALVRPYSIAIDSRGRAVISDPGAEGVHIFDLAQHKYKFIERRDQSKDPMLMPQCVAVDAKDNIYVTDSSAGKIFVFNADGKFQRVIGSLKGGEGYFKRPTGIAVDSQAGRIYVTDTLRDKIFVLDMQGEVLQPIGHHGGGQGEFNFPTELLLQGENLIVVDAMNFRVQVLDRQGAFRSLIGGVGGENGFLFRPKGIGIDSEDHLYIVDGLSGIVQVFDLTGQPLYYFGGRGAAAGQFQLPAGLFIDRNDRVFVVDSYNQRVQIFQYQGLPSRQGAQR